MINSNSKETELGSVFDDQTMKANDKVITTIYCLIFIIGLVCNVSGIGLNRNPVTGWSKLETARENFYIRRSDRT